MKEREKKQAREVFRKQIQHCFKRTGFFLVMKIKIRCEFASYTRELLTHFLETITRIHRFYLHIRISLSLNHFPRSYTKTEFAELMKRSKKLQMNVVSCCVYFIWKTTRKKRGFIMYMVICCYTVYVDFWSLYFEWTNYIFLNLTLYSTSKKAFASHIDTDLASLGSYKISSLHNPTGIYRER